MKLADFVNWREVKTYLDCIMKANIEAGKLIFEFDEYTELLHARQIFNTVAEHWNIPICFKVINKELYFYRNDLV